MIPEIVKAIRATGQSAENFLTMQCGESTVLENLPTMPDRKWDFFNMKDALRSACTGAERHKMLAGFEYWV